MKKLLWALVLIFSFGLGVMTIQAMVASPLAMSLWVLACAVTLMLLLVLIVRSFRRSRLALAVLLALAGFAGGWLAMNSLFLNQERARPLPELKRLAPSQRDHTAVIYFTHGEPPAYDPMPWVDTLKEIDAAGAPFIPIPFRPFFFVSYRAEYLKLGGSPHNIMHQSMLDTLERKFRAAGDDSTRFYIAFLDSPPRPDEVVIRAANEGARKIIVANVFLTISSHTEEGVNQVRAVRMEETGVPVCFTEPLWSSDSLRAMFVDRARRNLNGMNKSDVGILLVGHGQPAAWDKIWPTQTSQEQEFREKVMDLLVADGYKRENISQAWMEFKEPGVKEVAAKIGRNSVKKIFVFAAAISASALHSLYDIPEEVRTANLPPGIEVVNLGAWDNDPLVIQAIAEKIQKCQ